MNIIFNSLLAQLVKYNVHTNCKITSIHAIFYHILFYLYRRLTPYVASSHLWLPAPACCYQKYATVCTFKHNRFQQLICGGKKQTPKCNLTAIYSRLWSSVFVCDSLSLKYKLYCNTNYYGSYCSVYCVAQDTNTNGHYTCHSRTGSKVCRSGRTIVFRVDHYHQYHHHHQHQQQQLRIAGTGHRFSAVTITNREPAFDRGRLESSREQVQPSVHRPTLPEPSGLGHW